MQKTSPADRTKRTYHKSDQATLIGLCYACHCRPVVRLVPSHVIALSRDQLRVIQTPNYIAFLYYFLIRHINSRKSWLLKLGCSWLVPGQVIALSRDQLRVI
jgi:hypothetical protein